MGKSDATTTSAQEKLMHRFDFTEDDLNANRRGTISEHQRARLRGMAHGIGNPKLALIVFIFPLLGLCLWVAMSLQNEDTRAVWSNSLNVVLVGLSILVLLAILAGILWRNRKLGEGLKNAPLSSVVGKAKVTPKHFKRGGYGYQIQVGEKRYNFGDEYGRYFKDGTMYRIYYCQSGPYDPILSVDVLKFGGGEET